MEEMKELIEDYQDNLKKFRKLQCKLFDLLDYNTKVTASYSHTPSGSKGSVNSKVERYALKIYETEQELMEVGNKLSKVNVAEKILTDKEKEVIELIKKGYRNKLTKIAKLLCKDKKYVFDTRNRAIKKMTEYIEGR